MEKLLTKDDVCELLGISQNTLYRMINRREISCIRVSGSYKFLETDVEQYLAAQRIDAQPISKGVANLKSPEVRRGRPTINFDRCEYVPGMKVV